MGATALFYAAMSLINGWLERQGTDIPKRHGAKRRMIDRRLPHLHDGYDTLRSMGEEAGHGQSYAMGSKDRQAVRNLHESISAAIPWKPADA